MLNRYLQYNYSYFIHCHQLPYTFYMLHLKTNSIKYDIVSIKQLTTKYHTYAPSNNVIVIS